MALTVFKTFTAGETLTASDLNSMFTNIHNNPMSLISPLTSNIAAGGYDITGMGVIGFNDEGAPASAGDLRRNSTRLSWHNGTAAKNLAYTDETNTLILFTPESATFPTSDFPQLVKNAGTNWVDYTLDYNKDTSEAAYWFAAIPTGVTVTPTATLEIFSRQAAATTGTVGWTVTTLTRATSEAWDTAGNADTVTADTVEGTAGMVHRQSKALTTTGWAAGEVLQIKIARDIADTVAEDAKLIRAVLRIT